MTPRGMHFWLVVLACAVDGVVAILLVLVGASLTSATGVAIPRAAARSEFAVGMLVGGLAWMAWILATLFLVHACWCWYRLRKFGPRHSPTWGGIAMLLFAPLAAAAFGIAVALRLLD